MSDTIPENIPQKQCTRCKEWKPLTAEYFFRNRDSFDGFHTQCKPCQRTPIPGTTKTRTAPHRDQFGRIASCPQGGRVLDVPSKICSRCHIEKPLDQYNSQKKGLYGVESLCKECKNAEGRERYARRYGRRRDPLPDPVNGGKVCRRCKMEKPYDMFSPDKRASDGRTTQCKQCVREVQLPHAERNLARGRAIREKERELYQEKARNWKKANPLKVRQINARREAIKKKAQVEGEVNYESIRARDTICYICEQPLEVGQRTAFDHVIPLVPLAGTNREPGTHTESNIRCVHYLCNARKGQKLLEEMSPHDRRGVKRTHIIQPQLFSSTEEKCS